MGNSCPKMHGFILNGLPAVVLLVVALLLDDMSTMGVENVKLCPHDVCTLLVGTNCDMSSSCYCSQSSCMQNLRPD